MNGIYEMVIGLEVHVELKTKSKIFCGCSTAFGAEPNTQCCPVCMGMPGTLPVLNQKVVEYAIKAGLATNCQISQYSKQDRKNYFYPDLPKAYQISQYDLPLCKNGYLEIETDGGSKRIGITRIHIEEDAGKLVHLEGKGTLLDYNRCGVPLIEIVSEPDIRSAEEAKAYLQKLRAVILYTGISDCKMNEGSFRCDVNLSVRKKGGQKFGTRTEMKNLNSFQSVVRAIAYEYERQVQVLEDGGEIVQETRRFDQDTGKTSAMRRKEDADDYRYFPDPDLAPIEVSREMLEAWKAQIPPLPDKRKQEYMRLYSLTPYAAEQITCRLAVADYFEQAAGMTAYPRLAANLIQGEILRLLPQDSEVIPVAPGHLAAAAQMMGEERINSSTCRRLIQALWESDQDPEAYIKDHGLEQINDEAILEPLAREVLAGQEKSVRDYRAGKEAALQALVGQMMRKTGGRGNPARIRGILVRLLA